MGIEVSGLAKRFTGPSGSVVAIKDVSFSVDDGEFVAVEGPSGCGKTTLLMILGALLHPSEGRVLIDGREPYEMTLETRSRFRGETIGFVFQEFHLIPYLSVLDNVLAPSLVRPRAGGRARALDLIQHFQLSERAQHTPALLSTGERQRTALARALFHEPKLLLTDEPTGNLDGDNAERVLRHLVEFARNGGAVVMVTHSEAAASYADRVLKFESGRTISATVTQNPTRQMSAVQPHD